MKPMKNTFLLAIVGAAIATASVAHAGVVNIQFDGYSYWNAGTYTGNQGAYTGDNVASPTWNSFTCTSSSTASGSMSNLVASDGTATTEAVSFTSTGSWNDVNSYGSNPFNILLNAYLYSTAPSTAPSTVTLTGLTAGGSYDLYLYGQNGQGYNNGAAFSITTGTGSPITGSNSFTTGAITTGASAPTFQENANYVIFNATANSLGTLGISYSPVAGASEGDFNGLQVISTAAAVPEPASVGLLGAGALGLLLLGRKRKTA